MWFLFISFYFFLFLFFSSSFIYLFCVRAKLWIWGENHWIYIGLTIGIRWWLESPVAACIPPPPPPRAPGPTILTYEWDGDTHGLGTSNERTVRQYNRNKNKKRQKQKQQQETKKQQKQNPSGRHKHYPIFVCTILLISWALGYLDRWPRP